MLCLWMDPKHLILDEKTLNRLIAFGFKQIEVGSEEFMKNELLQNNLDEYERTNGSFEKKTPYFFIYENSEATICFYITHFTLRDNEKITRSFFAFISDHTKILKMLFKNQKYSKENTNPDYFKKLEDLVNKTIFDSNWLPIVSRIVKNNKSRLTYEIKNISFIVNNTFFFVETSLDEMIENINEKVFLLIKSNIREKPSMNKKFPNEMKIFILSKDMIRSMSETLLNIENYINSIQEKSIPENKIKLLLDNNEYLTPDMLYINDESSENKRKINYNLYVKNKFINGDTLAIEKISKETDLSTIISDKDAVSDIENLLRDISGINKLIKRDNMH